MLIARLDTYTLPYPHDSVIPANVHWREALAEELVAMVIRSMHSLELSCDFDSLKQQ